MLAIGQAEARQLTLAGAEPASFTLISPEAQFRLHFSQEVDSVAAGSVRVLANQSGLHPVGVTLSDGDVIVQPEGQFWAGETIRLAIRAGSVFAMSETNEEPLELRFRIGSDPGNIGFALVDSLQIPGDYLPLSMGFLEATGDDEPELVVSTGYRLLIYSGLDGGQFDSPIDIGHFNSLLIRVPFQSVAADYLDDASHDVMSMSSGSLAFRLINGASSLEAIQLPSPLFPEQAAAFDLDGDGKDEMIVLDADECGYSQLKWTDNVPAAFPATDIGGCLTRASLQMVDLERDGRLEMIAGRIIQILVRENDVFVAGGQTALTSRPGWNSADLSKDGLVDVIGYNGVTSGGVGGSEVVVAFGRETGFDLAPFGFAEKQRFFVEGLVQMDIGDLDGDGDLDLVTLSSPDVPEPSFISLFENDGSGTFVFLKRQTLPFSDSNTSAVLADWDNDGKLDYIVRSRESIWLLNAPSLSTEIEQTSMRRNSAIQAYPNPFRSRVSLSTSAESQIFIVFDATGRKVATVESQWNGQDDTGRAVPSGVYFIREENGSSYVSVVKR